MRNKRNKYHDSLVVGKNDIQLTGYVKVSVNGIVTTSKLPDTNTEAHCRMVNCGKDMMRIKDNKDAIIQAQVRAIEHEIINPIDKATFLAKKQAKKLHYKRLHSKKLSLT